MLDCRRDRLDYGEQLKPPSGYRLDRAIAATYSADLGTLLSIPVALVYAQTMEGDLTGARFQLLEAIKQFSCRVRVYHQAGQLHVPAKLNWLYAHLEEALVPILPDDAFTAFHPKVWVIRFAPDEEDDTSGDAGGLPNRFRLLVLSRNLTFDRSWDVAASLEGEPGTSVLSGNKPLVDFLRWLDSQQPIEWFEGFVEELARVEFATPGPFDRHAFHPLGIPGHVASPVASVKSKRTVVLSPFLDATAVNDLVEQTSGELNLFSQAHELAKLPAPLLEKLKSYHLSDLIVDGESIDAAEDGSADIQKQQLHAKVFVMRSEGETRWFLGSANATTAARTRNVEFMLELSGSSGKARIWRLLQNLIGEQEGDGPFVPFDAGDGGNIDPERDKKERLVRQFEYALLKSPINARVEPSENGKNFDLFLRFDLRGVPRREEFRVLVQPFNVKSKPDPAALMPGEIQEVTFLNLGEVELSRFLQFRIEDREEQAYHEFLLRIEIANLPTDRLDNILRRIIDSSDKFFEYLRFLLADEITKEDLLDVGGEEAMISSPDDESDHGWQINLPIYEQLLVVASRNPLKLRDVDELIGHLAETEPAEVEAGEVDSGGTPVIPEAFLSFWEAFRHLIPKEAKTTPPN